jgi:hypothetical protein
MNTEPKSQTPLTDAAQQEYDHNTCGVSRDFARSLELKLQEAEAELSWWKDFEHRIGHALDGVGMSTDEPADINIVNMGKRIVELKEKLQEAERQRDEAKATNAEQLAENEFNRDDVRVSLVTNFEEQIRKLEKTNAELLKTQAMPLTKHASPYES